ncbi:MAG: hypothetical protein HUU15_12995 [Candidatus Brocadiae bacterium]|nr:hypothetical protein [Candidatus Brocadiia bacterium]
MKRAPGGMLFLIGTAATAHAWVLELAVEAESGTVTGAPESEEVALEGSLGRVVLRWSDMREVAVADGRVSVVLHDGSKVKGAFVGAELRVKTWAGPVTAIPVGTIRAIRISRLDRAPAPPGPPVEGAPPVTVLATVPDCGFLIGPVPGPDPSTVWAIDSEASTVVGIPVETLKRTVLVKVPEKATCLASVQEGRRLAAGGAEWVCLIDPVSGTVDATFPIQGTCRHVADAGPGFLFVVTDRESLVIRTAAAEIVTAIGDTAGEFRGAGDGRRFFGDDWTLWWNPEAPAGARLLRADLPPRKTKAKLRISPDLRFGVTEEGTAWRIGRSDAAGWVELAPIAPHRAAAWLPDGHMVLWTVRGDLTLVDTASWKTIAVRSSSWTAGEMIVTDAGRSAVLLALTGKAPANTPLRALGRRRDLFSLVRVSLEFSGTPR